MTSEERAQAVLATFWWGVGFQAGPTQIDAVAAAIRCGRESEQEIDALRTVFVIDGKRYRLVLVGQDGDATGSRREDQVKAPPLPPDA